MQNRRAIYLSRQYHYTSNGDNMMAAGWVKENDLEITRRSNAGNPRVYDFRDSADDIFSAPFPKPYECRPFEITLTRRHCFVPRGVIQRIPRFFFKI